MASFFRPGIPDCFSSRSTSRRSASDVGSLRLIARTKEEQNRDFASEPAGGRPRTMKLRGLPRRVGGADQRRRPGGTHSAPPGRAPEGGEAPRSEVKRPEAYRINVG